MIEILKRIREWVGDHIDEMILSGFIITIFVLSIKDIITLRHYVYTCL